MKVIFSTYASNHYTSIEQQSEEEFTTSATAEEIENAYLHWLDEVVGNGWVVVKDNGEEITNDEYACMTYEMKEKEFSNG